MFYSPDFTSLKKKPKHFLFPVSEASEAPLQFGAGAESQTDLSGKR